MLVDIDGTLATRVTDRSPYDWQRVGEDAPVEAVVAAVRALHAAGHTILVLSGRDEECRRQTESWLTHHLGVPYERLLMRRARDNRRDDIVKRELYERHIKKHYSVLFVLDDRAQVVKMWRKIGLVCFQVAAGDF
ncbi:polynucleotide kinase [Cryptosporangium sp. NPDC048952]|uniref:phosphatase domain-containing protein n=1 Tax=Cryptosporangium sp. NPDC048952 TaxID=3363961 RepID=UPI0037138D2A